MNSVTNSSAAAILQDIQVPSCSVYLQGPCSVWSRKINSLGSHGHLTQVFFYMFFSLQVALFAHVSVFPSHGFLHLLYRHSKYIYFSGGNIWLLNCFIYLLKNYFNKHAFFFLWKLENNTSLPHFCIYFYRLQVGYFIYIQFEWKDIILVLVFPHIHADGIATTDLWIPMSNMLPQSLT